MRKQCKLFISLPAGGIQTGKTRCLGTAVREEVFILSKLGLKLLL